MNTKVKNLFFILILGSVCAFLLIGMRNYTLPRIERYRELTLKSNILKAAGLDYEEANLEEVFGLNMREIKRKGFTYYLSPDDLYIFIFEGRGLWGMITGAIAIKPDIRTIDNIRICAQEETPGLGGRISESSFLDQFKGKIVAPRLILSLRKKATEMNEIDSITGASMTSKALIDMINEAVVNFRDIVPR